MLSFLKHLALKTILPFLVSHIVVHLDTVEKKDGNYLRIFVSVFGHTLLDKSIRLSKNIKLGLSLFNDPDAVTKDRVQRLKRNEVEPIELDKNWIIQYFGGMSTAFKVKRKIVKWVLLLAQWLNNRWIIQRLILWRIQKQIDKQMKKADITEEKFDDFESINFENDNESNRAEKSTSFEFDDSESSQSNDTGTHHIGVQKLCRSTVNLIDSSLQNIHPDMGGDEQVLEEMANAYADLINETFPNFQGSPEARALMFTSLYGTQQYYLYKQHEDEINGPDPDQENQEDQPFYE